LNYHAAYGGDGSLSSLETSREEEWIVTLQPGATDAQIAALCQQARQGCKMSGHPDKGGVAFLDMLGTERDLEKVIESNRALVKFVEPDQVLYMIPEMEADPQAAASWGLNRVGATGRSSNLGAQPIRTSAAAQVLQLITRAENQSSATATWDALQTSRATALIVRDLLLAQPLELPPRHLYTA